MKSAIYSLKDFPDVYEPSEDSFLFLDALESELPVLKLKQPTLIAEVGSGSGIISASLAKELNGTYFTSDVNPSACQATQSTASLNNVTINPIRMDLLTNFRSNLFDVVLFNPPYVVTDSVETTGYGINRAWAGGIDGREIIDRFLLDLTRVLQPDGILYLLLLKENKIDDVIEMLKAFHFRHEIVKERKIQGEYLYVVKFTLNKI